MTGKDPKDMTASELLRWAANGEPYVDDDGGAWEHPLNKLRLFLRENNEGSLGAIADKIDAELAKAHDANALAHIDYLVGRNRWPGRREEESITGWLERCFLPRPRFEDGEPVQFGDEVDTHNSWQTSRVTSFKFTKDGSYVYYKWAGRNDGASVCGERVRRPAPEVLLADGLPAKVGETVWLTDEGAAHAGTSMPLNGAESCGLFGVGPDSALVVADVRYVRNGHEFVSFDHCDNPWCPASWLTHKEPDSIAKIEADAVKTVRDYWGCRDTPALCPCDCCPAEVGGKAPYERYGTYDSDYSYETACARAAALDILARQRAVLARGGE